MARASALHAEGQGFESLNIHHFCHNKTLLMNNKIILYTEKKFFSENKDPDIFNIDLRDCQQWLYSRDKLCLHKGKNLEYDYLFLETPCYMRIASDCIINMNENYREYKQTNEQHLSNTSDYFRGLYQKYVDSAYTIGGEIIFPKRLYSINVIRGQNTKIKDRFDLTLECIKRFYASIDNPDDGIIDNPLYETLDQDRAFFSLFDGFRDYVNFFFLDDLVKNDNVKFYFGEYDDDVFNHSALAWNQSEWEQMLENQLKFLDARNTRIHKFCNQNKQKTKNAQ